MSPPRQVRPMGDSAVLVDLDSSEEADDGDVEAEPVMPGEQA